MERIKEARRKARTVFVQDVGRALSGQMGNPEVVTRYFADTYNRNAAHAVIQLMKQALVVENRGEISERADMRSEAGFN